MEVIFYLERTQDAKIPLIGLPAFFVMIGQALLPLGPKNCGPVFTVSGYTALQIGKYDGKARSIARSARHGNLSVVLFNNTLCYC